MISAILIIFCLLFLLFLSSIYTKDNSKIDIFWGIGFVIIAWGIFFEPPKMQLLQWCVLTLITLWGLRLAGYIGWKKLQNPGEDARYAVWRSQWKYFYTRSFFQIYILQGILMCIVAMPLWLLYGDIGEIPIGWITVGMSISFFGLLYESRADYELSQFLKIKKPGDILTGGLRKYHRYPQYFGESVFWFGISFLVAPINLWAFIGWGLITVLVCFVSGIAMSERKYKDNKKYAHYREHTLVFFPRYF
ncbi:DUF1295 domain-containing protein [Candidatus Gracilibacteria bacterium]|nr:DUF1295 domain-containing protein [Candidatus Gracilibacteria bacterium]